MTTKFYWTVKISLERTDIQKGVIVEALLDSRATELVMSLEFARKQGFKLKKIKRLIYVRNVNGIFNLCPFFISLIINIYFHHIFYRPFLINIIRGQI